MCVITINISYLTHNIHASIGRHAYYPHSLVWSFNISTECCYQREMLVHRGSLLMHVNTTTFATQHVQILIYVGDVFSEFFWWGPLYIPANICKNAGNKYVQDGIQWTICSSDPTFRPLFWAAMLTPNPWPLLTQPLATWEDIQSVYTPNYWVR